MSVSRYCNVFKAVDGTWWLELGNVEYSDWNDSTTYGPFGSQEAVKNYLRRFANPGAMWLDEEGTAPRPIRSNDGSAVVSP